MPLGPGPQAVLMTLAPVLVQQRLKQAPPGLRATEMAKTGKPEWQGLAPPQQQATPQA